MHGSGPGLGHEENNASGFCIAMGIHHLMRRYLLKPRLCVVCSAGGHLAEALAAIEMVQHDMCIVTHNDEHVASLLKDYRAYYVLDPHTSVLKYALNFIQSAGIFLRERPRVVLTTGAGIALSMCLLGKAFGSRVVYVESGARVTTPSRTGCLLDGRADLFIVQWRQMLDHHPQAVYGGPLL